MGGMPMRGIAVLLANLVGLSALVSVAVVGVIALHSSPKSMQSAPPAAAASRKARLPEPAKPAAPAHQKAAHHQKRKVAHVTRKRKEEAPMFSSGFDAYGFAPQPRRFYQYPTQFFGR